jgi:hypothetical protein
MTKLWPSLIAWLLLCPGMLAQSTGRTVPLENPGAQRLAEQKHYLDCLASVYTPAFWISYNDALYFQPKTEEQMRQLEAMKLARARYLVLTNREIRHQIAAEAIAASGIEESWQRKILLPFSTTNADLTPTLGRPLRFLPQYRVVKSFASHDALLQDGAASYFVMDFGRGASDGSGTNACLIKEGMKSYTDGGGLKTVEAFMNVALSQEEAAVLNRVSAAFQKQAAARAQEIDAPRALEEFEACKARATDANPYMEYLLAKCYLEGKGTEKDEKLGLEWMRRAARSGSGDASAFLERAERKGP